MTSLRTRIQQHTSAKHTITCFLGLGACNSVAPFAMCGGSIHHSKLTVVLWYTLLALLVLLNLFYVYARATQFCGLGPGIVLTLKVGALQLPAPLTCCAARTFQRCPPATSLLHAQHPPSMPARFASASASLECPSHIQR